MHFYSIREKNCFYSENILYLLRLQNYWLDYSTQEQEKLNSMKLLLSTSKWALEHFCSNDSCFCIFTTSHMKQRWTCNELFLQFYTINKASSLFNDFGEKNENCMTFLHFYSNQKRSIFNLIRGRCNELFVFLQYWKMIYFQLYHTRTNM